MALPASGQISMSQVNTELTYSATAQISLNDAAVRSLAGVSSGAISLDNLHGKSNTYNIEYLVVGGGASGAGGLPAAEVYTGGAGGAGGVVDATGAVSPGTAYSITIGAGGAALSGWGNGTAGGSSALNTIATASGGGGGGVGNNAGGVGGGGGGGGSGGGGGAGGVGGGAGGAGTSPQGYAGQNGGTSSSTGGYGGGSGGTGASGGPGTDWKSLGVIRGVGGRGQGQTVTGAPNTGNGGSGAPYGASSSYSGGSGVCIVRYAGIQRGTGGTVTSSGGYTYHTFNSSGTYTA